MDRKLKVGVIGGTGLVGQRFVTFLQNHPWFEVVSISASQRSAGKTYAEAVENRWKLQIPIPKNLLNIVVQDAFDIKKIADEVDFVFCAIDLEKKKTMELEENYAKAEIPLISNNSAHRLTPDVPMVIPEVNWKHISVIESQRKRLGTKSGFIAVKPNCSLQSYVPAISALNKFVPQNIVACTYQAISGGSKTFADWPEMIDNVIPFINGEEEKSETEPLKIWGRLTNNEIIPTTQPKITSQCIRVPVSDGHLAAVYVKFENKPARDEIISLWSNYKGEPQIIGLPSAPKQFLTYMSENDRPQTKLDRDLENGMGISIGRLREDTLFDYKFVSLSHNALRGAAGGAVLIAELLTAKGYISHK